MSPVVQSELEATREAAEFTSRSNGWTIDQYARHDGEWYVSFTDGKREGNPQVVVNGPKLIHIVALRMAGLSHVCEDCQTGYYSAAAVVAEPCERCGGGVVRING